MFLAFPGSRQENAPTGASYKSQAVCSPVVRSPVWVKEKMTGIGRELHPVGTLDDSADVMEAAVVVPVRTRAAKSRGERLVTWLKNVGSALGDCSAMSVERIASRISLGSSAKCLDGKLPPSDGFLLLTGARADGVSREVGG